MIKLLNALKYSLILVSIILFLSACQPETKGKVDIPAQDDIQISEVEKSIIASESERSYWQKPDLVLGKLGNIEEKVIADIGAGMGYFSFELSKRKAKKVIAVDIDEEMIKALNFFKNLMEEKELNFGERFEVRQATAEDSKIEYQEVDIILIVNTIAYINPKTPYLANLRSKLKEGGKLIIVDFKTKQLPEYVNAPPYSDRVYIHVIEEELQAAGFSAFESDDTTLEYQYIVIAEK